MDIGPIDTLLEKGKKIGTLVTCSKKIKEIGIRNKSFRTRNIILNT